SLPAFINWLIRFNPAAGLLHPDAPPAAAHPRSGQLSYSREHASICYSLAGYRRPTVTVTSRQPARPGALVATILVITTFDFIVAIYDVVDTQLLMTWSARKADLAAIRFQTISKMRI
ncbi:hypothetical protein BaRGS_00003605, partial [Batillaria attramentaria]